MYRHQPPVYPIPSTFLPSSPIPKTVHPSPRGRYEKKSRRKTREDRYIPKDIARDKYSTSSAKGPSVKKPQKTKLSKRKHGKNLEEEFTAANVSQGRLTVRALYSNPKYNIDCFESKLSSSFDVGLFARGRASSPIRRFGLPDLTFSEMKFLSRPAKQNGTLGSTQVNKPSTSNKPPILDISEYFSQPQPANDTKKLHSSLSLLPTADPLTSQCHSSLTGNIRPTQTHEFITSDPQLGSKICDPPKLKQKSRSSSCFSWSESERTPGPGPQTERLSQLSEAGLQRNAPGDIVEGIPHVTDTTGSSLPMDEFQYDPFLLSRVYDMVFKNAYLDQTQQQFMQRSDSECFCLEDLQKLANPSFTSIAILETEDKPSSHNPIHTETSNDNQANPSSINDPSSNIISRNIGTNADNLVEIREGLNPDLPAPNPSKTNYGATLNDNGNVTSRHDTNSLKKDEIPRPTADIPSPMGYEDDQKFLPDISRSSCQAYRAQVPASFSVRLNSPRMGFSTLGVKRPFSPEFDEYDGHFDTPSNDPAFDLSCNDFNGSNTLDSIIFNELIEDDHTSGQSIGFGCPETPYIDMINNHQPQYANEFDGSAQMMTLGNTNTQTLSLAAAQGDVIQRTLNIPSSLDLSSFWRPNKLY
ncbi:hypothetical protein LOZ12_002335 [Ophidiomyces ophidiicola]|uniref:Uncharacterized protein n=1 Tax=Ophidiomyces ophidiicola TaxID=1387563 RepID=A0ACB8UXH9_9EURO|nr:hypothetical protein LOZ62_003735 [Ophidiomyces ophidiicola]KAI1972281.1 hypothetical protein LOZ56_002498 [Ophidiomyces ophidiicola]KAI2005907.1 hypothetical protein LOZ50_003443 [Ophidiomyces ophidiicola]KAI2024234.1 hypothetical protein LOZ48_005802 [Ophidiomyces ophidiicola]KAI2038454.1 hypothetical protein LOZ47_003227 [Ophidiomyces ophidiicola]